MDFGDTNIQSIAMSFSYGSHTWEKSFSAGDLGSWEGSY